MAVSVNKRKSNNPYERYDNKVLNMIYIIFRRDRLGLISIILLFPVVFGALFAPYLTPHNPTRPNITQRLLPPFWMENGSRDHLLGTDQLGRDTLTRMLYGGRISLIVGFASVLISLPLGLVIGLVSGYYGSFIETFFMRLGDIQLSFPFMLLAIAIVAVLGPGLLNVILVLGITGWVQYARITRGQVLSLKEYQFVEAAHSLGAHDRSVIFKHILPNVLTPNFVIATYSIGYMILIESSLSFLGLGVPPPAPSYGGMINDGRHYITIAWWLPIFPGIFLGMTILGTNLLGEWARERLDPKKKLS